MTLILERKGKETQHNRKTKQHHTTCPKQLFLKEKLAASGGTETYDHPLSRQRTLLPTELPRQLAGMYMYNKT